MQIHAGRLEAGRKHQVCMADFDAQQILGFFFHLSSICCCGNQVASCCCGSSGARPPDESAALCPQNAATESFLGWTLLTQLPGSAQEGMEGQGSWGPARSFPQDGAHGGGRGRTLLAQKVAVEASRLERKS